MYDVEEIVNAEIPEWTGTATELISKLSLDIQPNTMTRHLNVNADRLFYEYQIAYENTRTHAGRQVTFRYVPKEE